MSCTPARAVLTTAAVVAALLTPLSLTGTAHAAGEAVSVVVSSADGAYRLAAQPDLTFAPGGGSGGTTIEVDPLGTHQTMLGIGTSMELTSISNLLRLRPDDRQSVIEELFDPVEGIGLNMLRIPFGTPDFTGTEWYTYNDLPAGQTDASLSGFSIQKDRDYRVIEVIKQIRQVNPEVRVYASIWSPPGWMKDSGTVLGGNMKAEWIAAHAIYVRKAVQAYEAEGIPIFAVSPQNEPNNCGTDYPQTCWSWELERDAVKAMRAEFTANGLTTKIWIGDADFELWDVRHDDILDDPAAAAAVDGAAFHPYNGEPSAMTDLQQAHPNTPVLLTERGLTGIEVGTEVTQYLRNRASLWAWWVPVMDETGGPNNGPFKGFDESSLVSVPSNDPDGYSYAVNYYLTGQFAQYIERGAVRIDSSAGSASTVTSVAFQNPDGRIATVVTNATPSSQMFRIVSASGHASAALPPNSIGTYSWTPGSREAGNLVRNGSFEADFTDTQTPQGWSTYTGSGTADADYAEKDDAHAEAHQLVHWRTTPYTAFTNQTVTGLADGTYTLSAHVRSSGGQRESWMEIRDYGGAKQTVAIPTTSTWTRISIPDVQVTDGQALIGFWSDAGANQWINVDSVQFIPTSGTLTTNGGFEDDGAFAQTPVGWGTWTGSDAADADYAESGDNRTGLHHLVHWRSTPYTVFTNQTVTGLDDGTHTLAAYVKSSGGQRESWMEIRDYGGAKRTVAIPATSTWTRISIGDVQVSNGQALIGFWSDASAGQWINVDDVELLRG